MTHSRRQFIKNSITTVATIPFLQNIGCSTKTSRPNFLLIQLDDLGWDDLSLHGNTYVETPNIDALAKESVQFKQFYVNPVCAPTRASLLTGRHFLRTGVSHVHGGKDFIHLDEMLLPQLLKKGGYKTGVWGKWHSGHTDGYFPWQRGFDEAYMAQLYKHKDSRGMINGKNVEHNNWADKVCTDYAIEFIQKNQHNPFFAYVPYLTPHAPLVAPEQLIKKYVDKNLPKNLAILYAMVDHVDSQIKRLLDELDNLHLVEKTVVIFMSDNGPAIINNYLTDADRKTRYVNKLKGHKGNIWENGVKSPLFVRWPEKFKPFISNELTDVTDIFPTLLDIAGIPLPNDNLPLDGISFKNTLYGKKSNREKITFNYANIGWPPTDKPWSPVGTHDEYRPIPPEKRDGLLFSSQIISVRKGPYKLLMNPGKTIDSVPLYEGFALFNLEKDSGENNNLMQTEPELAQNLSHELEKWFNSIRNEHHAYNPPVFQIGPTDTHDNVIWAKGAYDISPNLKNTFNWLENWTQNGEWATFHINCLQAGDYSITLNYEKSSTVEGEISITCQNESINTSFTNPKTVELSPLKIEKGLGFLKIQQHMPHSFNKLYSLKLKRLTHK